MFFEQAPLISVDLGGKELQRTLQAVKEPERRSGLLGNAKHGSPNGLSVFSRRVKERFPNTYTLCTYCAFQKRKLLSKVKLRHTGRKVKTDTPNSETDSVVGTWYLVTRLELTSWRKLGCPWWVRGEGEKDQKGQLLKTCPNNSKACAVILPFELRRRSEPSRVDLSLPQVSTGERYTEGPANWWPVFSPSSVFVNLCLTSPNLHSSYRYCHQQTQNPLFHVWLLQHWLKVQK